jgi:nitrate/nitrite transporter NarK
VLAAVIVLTLGVGGAAYAVDTAAQTHSGLIPTSGPTTSAIGGGQGGIGTLLAQTTTKWAAATTGSQSAASLELSSGNAVIAVGGRVDAGGVQAVRREQPDPLLHRRPTKWRPGRPPGRSPSW